jgi:chromosome segregation ATPase
MVKEIKILYAKLEDKCEQVELLNNEISKLKDNYNKLNFERKENCNYYEMKIKQLNMELEKKSEQIDSLNKELEKQKDSYKKLNLETKEEFGAYELKIKKLNEKIKDFEMKYEISAKESIIHIRIIEKLNKKLFKLKNKIKETQTTKDFY